MCDTPNGPLRNTSLLPTGHWGTAAFDNNMGHVHRENVPSAKLPQMRMTSRGNVPNFSLTPIWPGYPQLGCYQYHQPIVLGSLWWRLWSIAINKGHLKFLNDKNFMKPINYAHINIFHEKGYWFKIWMEFLWPLLAKIELICQQLAMPQLIGVEGVASQPWGAG